MYHDTIYIIIVYHIMYIYKLCFKINCKLLDTSYLIELRVPYIHFHTGTNNVVTMIMNHDSGFIIGIADVFFAKILIEHTPKTCLKKHPPTSMSNCKKTEICHFVHILIHNIIIIVLFH